jgi:hypothetical protein
VEYAELTWFCFLDIRAIKEASKFGSKEQDWDLKAATRFAAEFDYLWWLLDKLMGRLIALMPQPASEKEA